MNKHLDQANVIQPAYVVVTELRDTDAVNVETVTTDRTAATVLAYRLGGQVWTVTGTLNLTHAAQDDE